MIIQPYVRLALLLFLTSALAHSASSGGVQPRHTEDSKRPSLRLGLLAAATHKHEGQPLYVVSIGDTPWLVGTPIQIYCNGSWFSSDGTSRSRMNATKALILTQNTTTTGHDQHGPFQQTVWIWSSSSSQTMDEHTKVGAPMLQTIFRVYAAAAGGAGDAIVFEQVYLTPCHSTATRTSYGVRGNSSPLPDLPISSFPSFNNNPNSAVGPAGLLPSGSLGFISWDDSNPQMARRGQNGIGTGLWPGAKGTTPAPFQGGLFGGGVLSFSQKPFSARADLAYSTLVLSQFSEFFCGSLALVNNDTELRVGLLGGTTAVQAGQRLSFLLFHSEGGVNAAYRGWGDMLLRQYHKERVPVDASRVLTHLGYSTTAFYFYETLSANTTYTDTVLAVAKAALKQGIPFHYYLLDSWWYGEDCFGGVDRWDEVAAEEQDCALHTVRFPEGLGGLAKALDELSLPWQSNDSESGSFVLHLGKWIQNTTYARNQAFDFYVHQNASDPMWGGALSVSSTFWQSLINQARLHGLNTLKQDHVDNQIAVTPPCWQQPGFTMAWLEVLDEALLNAGAKLTAGGYTHRGWLHSVKLRTLTHARVAPDYYGWHDGDKLINTGDYWNWSVGPHALLSWAVGLWSYKDSWYSSSSEVNWDSRGEKKFYGFTEPYPWTQALSAALSGGPIAPGDGVPFTEGRRSGVRGGGANVSLILSTCMLDGTLLKPDRPAVSADAYWLSKMFEPNASLPNEAPVDGVLGRDGQLWVTHTTCDGDDETHNLTWAFVTGIGLQRTYDMCVKELWHNVLAWAPDAQVPPPYGAWAFEWSAGDYHATPFGMDRGRWPNEDAEYRTKSSSESCLHFETGPDYGSVSYYIAAPRLSNGWTLLGEQYKLIPVSRQRFAAVQTFNVNANKAGLNITVRGVVGEKIRLASVSPAGKHIFTDAVFRETGLQTVLITEP